MERIVPCVCGKVDVLWFSSGDAPKGYGDAPKATRERDPKVLDKQVHVVRDRN